MKTKQIKYIWEVSRGQRGRILLSCLTGIIGVAVSLAFIYASKVVIDIATGAAIGSLTNAAILTIALLIAQLLCGAVDTWLSTRMQVETGNALRHRLFSRLLQSRWNELERFHTGDIVNRVEQDTASIVELLTSTIPAFIVTIVQLIAAFVFFCFLDPSLPWVVVGILPIFLLGSRFYMKRMRRYTREIRQSDSRIQSVIQESLQHRTVIKTLEQGDRHIGKLDDLQDALRNQIFGRTRFSLSARMLVAFAFSGGYLTAFLWGKVISPYGRGGGRHSGIDIKTCAKDTIRSAFDGIVRMSKPYSAYGNVIVVRHSSGLETIYSHNFKNLVQSGDVVKAGQPIALTGRTGRASTEHLHFETRINGQHFNPNLIFDFKERTLRKECIHCTKNGKGVIVKPATKKTAGTS